jgi:Leucine Rich repeat
MMQNGGVQYLDLSWNGLESAGCTAIAGALGESNALLTLDLSSTRMGVKPCDAFAKALSNNSTLQMLFVNGNQFGEEGARVLAKALTENRSLRYLGMAVRNAAESSMLLQAVVWRACVIQIIGQASAGADPHIAGDGATQQRVVLVPGRCTHDSSCAVMQSSATVMEPDSNHIDAEAIDEAHPEGTYNLDLASAHERDTLLTLIALDAACPEGSGKLLQNAKLNGIPVKDDAVAGWPDSLPAAGILECDFVRIPGSAGCPVLDGKKMYAIEKDFKRSTATDDSRVQTLVTLAPYSYLYAAQICRLLRHIGTGDQLVQTACVLLFRCVDLELGGFDMIFASLDRRTRGLVAAHVGMHGCFKGCNPTGHYALHLSEPTQRHLAARLKDCAMGEGGACLTWRNILCALFVAFDRS